MQRLDKTLSHELGITRSEAASSLRRGEVSVNGTVVKKEKEKIDPECDEIDILAVKESDEQPCFSAYLNKKSVYNG